MFRLGYLELVVISIAALFLFRAEVSTLFTGPRVEIDAAQPTINQAFVTRLGTLLGLFILAELWLLTFWHLQPFR